MRLDKCETIESYIQQLELDIQVLKELSLSSSREDDFNLDRYNKHRNPLENPAQILSHHRDILRRKENSK